MAQPPTQWIIRRNILDGQMVRRHWWSASCPSDALLLYSVGRFKENACKNNPHTPTQRTNLKKLSGAQQRQFETKISKKSFFTNCFARCLRIKGGSIRHVL